MLLFLCCEMLPNRRFPSLLRWQVPLQHIPSFLKCVTFLLWILSHEEALFVNNKSSQLRMPVCRFACYNVLMNRQLSGRRKQV